MNVIALAGVMLLLGLGAGRAEDYPSRPVRLISPRQPAVWSMS